MASATAERRPRTSDNGGRSAVMPSTPRTNADMRRRFDRGTAPLTNGGDAAAEAAAVATPVASPLGSTDG